MNMIVAVDENWAIGKGGEQLIYISADLKRFKALTMGHPLILGRKTLATFPGGKPLKGRRNLILSRNPDCAPEGAEVYRELLGRCDTVYVTKLHAAWPADCWFPNLDEDPAWIAEEEGEVLEEQGVEFHYVTYRKA